MEIGYWLSGEEHGPKTLVENARRAEDAGFEFLLISDHYHPWVNETGHSPFVWGVLGAIAEATERIRIGTAVTCPLIRVHPAIVAQASATAQILFDGRFFLGVGTGENLNEHIVGARWPRPDERLEMLAEAVEIIRRLWGGDYETYRGRHYTVEQARVYDVPERAPQLLMAAKAEDSTRLAAEKADGLMNTSPDEEVVQLYRDAGGSGPVYGKLAGAFASSRDEALRIAKERQPNAAMGGDLGQELQLPRDFEAVAQLVREDDLAESMPMGDDPGEWREKMQEFEQAGFTHLCLHDASTDQKGFIEFARQLR